MPQFLLHSLATFEPLISDVLEATGARTAVEIGGEGGTFTQQLVDWAERVDGEVHCVDPDPSIELERLAERTQRLRLLRATSPDALGVLGRLDAYVLDGDHNYWTVAAELAALESALLDPEHPSVVFLHDVGWPNARRDAYYDPKRLPDDAVHPVSWDGGVAPDAEEVGTEGFRFGHALARTEGGPRNGVLTAVEDFLVEREGLEHHIVPAVFGLGVLFGSAAPWAEQVRALVTPYQHDLIARLERNRVDLYLEVLRLQREIDHRSRVHQMQLARARAAGRLRSA